MGMWIARPVIMAAIAASPPSLAVTVKEPTARVDVQLKPSCFGNRGARNSDAAQLHQ
jgi:hypothetical protein